MFRLRRFASSSSSRGEWRGSLEFGFQSTPTPESKTRMVHQVFKNVSDQYDLMNDLMSAGVHRIWKDRFVDSLCLDDQMHVLDVAGGTGDIALRCLNKGAKVTVMDINEYMLQVGKQRLHGKNAEFIQGNAELLPFKNESMDVYTIAFGLRNVARIPLALQEANRVLKKGGRFACLEFSHVHVPVLDKIYELYSFGVIPEIGKWVTGDRESYQYLVESIARFPKPEELCQMIAEAGFEPGLVSYESLYGGIVAIHSAYKI
jgi:demethylmenaquinone methyltransferase / 2-methoxy-6-polyprenyl-1,4-benzoquinol methylase